MTAMDYLPSDLEHMNTNFLDMIESEANSQLFDIENLNSDKFNGMFSGDLLQETSQLGFENQNINENNWLQSFQWNDISKVPQSLIDASTENNNPNLMVNPQSVLPMHSTQLVHNNNNMTQHLNHINTRHGIAVKINGHDAVLTPTHHGQIQYITVQNLVSLNNHQNGYAVQPITICPQQVKSIGTVISQSLTSSALDEHLQNSVIHNNQQINNKNKEVTLPQKHEKVYPKPVYSYSCLIAMALKNSRTGNLPVCEIYNFMIDNFPYFKTAPDGWKNSVRHNLSLNKCFAKVDNGTTNGTHTRKGCLWALNPAKVEKMEEEIVKWRKKDPESVKLSMSKPENLELIEQGKAGPPREADEPCSPVKQEPSSVHVTPMKQHCRAQPESSIQANGVQLKTCKRELAVLVKSEPEIDIMTVKDASPFDPSVPDMVLQNDMWDKELTIGVGYPTSWSTMCPSPVMSPALLSNSQYHGNIRYTCGSPEIVNLTPTQPYPQTSAKLHLHTPSKLVLA